ncbi:MAG: nitrate reductase [Betaproteobacteria bacterium HGW-Betaproteobacteria-11]|nr:MAG: nitrate reductase [Betaproteobacteria bacterium HGW-Betaproteobacteria-11]
MGAVETLPLVQETRSTCPYCGTGCGVIIETVGVGTPCVPGMPLRGQVTAKIINVRGDPQHPANFGRLCSKGASLHLTTSRNGRALVPEYRATRAVPRTPTSWDVALDAAATRFAAIIQAHGPDAVAFYISGQLLTEDYYVFNKLARALVGTNNIDSNSRLCMSSAVAGYKATLGADAVPCSYEDIDLADLFLLAGSNTAWAHPIIFRRIEDAKAKNPALKIIVVDPRRTDTAAMADLHLALKPGTDAVLYSAMLHVLLWEDLIDEAFIAAHSSGFPALRAQLRELTPGAAAAVCGVAAEDIVKAARWFGQARAPLSMWCQGLNQSAHGTANNAALIHLHLATGTIGRPGMGPFSLTGQPNAMGGREVGAMANLLPGHRDLASPADREELARLWAVPSVPERPGKTAVELFDALHEGTIKAVWIACTNPAHSLPDQTRVRAALEKAEFVVLQESYRDTETAPFADLLLPAASWGEKEGTVTNSERRISRVRAAVAPPGEARPDWEIAAEFARRLGEKLGAGETAKRLFAFAAPADIFVEHAKLTQGRDLDIGGLGYPLLEQCGPQQWPFPQGAQQGTSRLYADHRFATADGRARFVPLDFALTAEATDARHPLLLTTGRLRDQWHGMSRTGRAVRLAAHEPTPRLLLHAADLARRGFKVGDLARITSRRGSIVLPVAVSEEMKPGQAFAAMHWGGRSLSHAGANQLMPKAFDPVSRQPELKAAAIRIERAELPHRLFLLRAAESASAEEQVLDFRERLARFLPGLDYAALTLGGRDHPFVMFSAASAMPFAEDMLEALIAAVELEESTVYRDPRRAIVKRAKIAAGDDRLLGILFSGETLAADWLRELMASGQPVGELRRYLFAPTATPPQALKPAGRTVCNCFGVSETEIGALYRQGLDLAAVQARLKCGTSCGSCLPELRRMQAAVGATVAPD